MRATVERSPRSSFPIGCGRGGRAAEESEEEGGGGCGG